MKDYVLIKSFPNGIALHLDKEAGFEQLLQEIAYKFSEARNFFGNATMALSIEDRKVSGAEEIRILDAVREDGQFFKGSLKNKEVLETENSIIILGDVYPGSAVISAKNIIILGGMYGEAYAGGNGQPDAFVAALEMEPERLKIGDFKYKTAAKQSKWGIRPKVQPKIAYVKNGKIIFEMLTKDLLSGF